MPPLIFYLKITSTILSVTLLTTLYPVSESVAIPPSANLQNQFTLQLPSYLTDRTPSIPIADHSFLSLR